MHEQNVRAPVPVQEQSFVPEKPEAQGVEQMPKSLDRVLGASELEKEEAYWNEFFEDEDNIEQLYQEWLSGAFEPLFYEDGRRERKSKKKKNLNRTVQDLERIPEHTVVSFDQEEKLNNTKFLCGPAFTVDDSVICEDTDLNQAAATGRSSRDVYTATY